MRLLVALAALAVAYAAPAAADPVALRPMTVDAKLQEKFDEDYGAREIAVLQSLVTRALTRELTAAGATIADAAPVTVETTLLDAKPSRPTMQQTIDTPGLDALRSISIGGAELRARLLDANGAPLGEVTYEWFETDLRFSLANGTWSDAQRAIRRFADKVGDAYRAKAGAAAAGS